jgi:hypothetical protein
LPTVAAVWHDLRLPAMVVIALGMPGAVAPPESLSLEDIRQLIEEMEAGHRVLI